MLAGDMKAALAGGAPVLLESWPPRAANMTTEEFDVVVKTGSPLRNIPRRDAVHRDGLPADDRTARLSSCQRFQDVHRVRRRRRLHARLCGEGLRHPARAGHRQHGQAEVRDARRQAGAHQAARLDFFDDKEAKPIAIETHIGRRPIAAFGNSDGDLQMLQWTAAGTGARFCLFVRHTDAEREWAYDVSPWADSKKAWKKPMPKAGPSWI